jgi:aminoglycoside phosphotransferase
MQLPGVTALAHTLLSDVGLVVRRPGAPPESTWFTGLIDGEAEVSGLVLNTSWRGPSGAVLLHAVDQRRGEALAIAKTWLSPEGDDAVEREARGLEDVAARAGQFGVRVPRLLSRGTLGEQPYVAESAVPGEKAAVLLHSRPQLLPALLAGLAGWLRKWNTATAQARVLTEESLGAVLLGPAAELLPALGLPPALGAPAGYMGDLQALAARLLGQRMPLVAAHGDLTMVNVLVDRAKHLGVIDWETASPSALPLVDFYYAVVDAVAAVDDYRDRPAAYAACFTPGGRYRGLVASLQAELVEELRLTPDQAALTFHAAWLKYALAEQRETAKTSPTEFLEIARRAAPTSSEHERERRRSR